MADDDVTQEPQKESEMIVEFTTNTEYLSACFYAMSAIEELDTTMYNNGKAIKQRVMQRCMKIIDLCVWEMYEELFDPTKDDD